MCCCVRASHRCALLSVISWHGLLWQRNKPAWPMITPTANRHLCMGEAWLGPQIAPTPPPSMSVCVCVQTHVCVKMHAGLTTSLCVLASRPRSTRMCGIVCVRPCIGSCEPYGFWYWAGFFKHWATDPDTPRRAKPENSSKRLLLPGIVFFFFFANKSHSSLTSPLSLFGRFWCSSCFAAPILFVRIHPPSVPEQHGKKKHC